MELWKDISGYEGFYQISNLGRIKSLERTFYSGKNHNIEKHYPSMILKNKVYPTTGYEYIDLSKMGVVKRFKIHRLVALAFIPNPCHKPFIDHINTIRNDNRVENLRWVNGIENMNNILTKSNFAASKLGDRNPMKRKQKPILQIVPSNGEIIAEYSGCKEAARELGLDSSCISRCCNGIYQKYRGYFWRFK